MKTAQQLIAEAKASITEVTAREVQDALAQQLVGERPEQWQDAGAGGTAAPAAAEQAQDQPRARRGR